MGVSYTDKKCQLIFPIAGILLILTINQSNMTMQNLSPGSTNQVLLQVPSILQLILEEGFRRKRIVGLMAIILTLMMIMMAGFTENTVHTVGSLGWIPNYNYTEWSSQRHFYVGDWLKFVFDKHMYNVLEVNETSYKNCNDQGFIKNITRGGRDVFELTEAMPYYFLSSGGYCWNGMKVAINVEQIPPAPAPGPSKNCSPSNNGRQMMLSIACYAALAWYIFLIV